MDFGGERECMLCGKEGLKANMVRMSNAVGIMSGWTCKPGECALPSSESRMPRKVVETSYDPEVKAWATAHSVPLVNNEHIQETAVEPRKHLHPLQDEFGFDKPEDGSERRFVFNAVKQGEKPPGVEQPVTVPWIKFRFWWWIHNAVAHPLIAIAPRRTFFRFHDYTSRKMHGK